MNNLVKSKDHILYSIITVTFNCVLQIEKTIKSILDQKLNNYEIIIIDGNSTDGTVEFLNKYKEFFTVFISEKDYGIYDAMNKGITYSNGEWLIFLNAGDTFYNESTLVNVTAHLNTNFSMIAGDSIYIKSNKSIFTKTVKSKPGYMPASHQSIFFCKKYLVNKNYNTLYKVAADYDLVCQLFKYKILYLNEIISIVDFYGFSNSNQDLYLKEYKIIINKYFSKFTYFKWSLFVGLKYRLKRYLNKISLL
jgi:glycosyltransferase involved in cell wall biosynthesis